MSCGKFDYKTETVATYFSIPSTDFVVGHLPQLTMQPRAESVLRWEYSDAIANV